MLALTLTEIAEAVGGVLSGADPDAVARDVVIDSRRASRASLFFALQGGTADGHGFVDHAVDNGAAACVVRTGSSRGAPAIEVDDPAAALRALAMYVRDRLDCTVIAVTGSSGKTSTRDLIAAGCATERRVVASPENYNNEIGVPLTILTADDRTEVLVAEVGARGIGHVAELMPLVRPSVSVVTNVGPAHIGEFGSLENIAIAKGELVEPLDHDGTAVLNADDHAVRAMAARTKGHVVMFGRSWDADVRIEDLAVDEDARAVFTLRRGGVAVPMHMRIAGEHMADNAAAAAAAAEAAGVQIEVAAPAIAACDPPAGRMEVSDAGGRRILNDAYNANPASMTAALKALVAMGGARPTWAVLGHMAELGDTATEEHDRIGRMAVRLGVGRLLVVGREAKAILEAARLEGMFDPEESFFADDPEQALGILRARCEADAIVLIKASRAAGLEVIAEALEDEA